MSTASSQPSPARTITSSLAGINPSSRTSDERDGEKEFNLDSIPRSASYTQFPATTPSDASFERNGIQRTFSENVIANPKANNFRHASIKRPSRQGDGLADSDGYAHLARRLSIKPKPETKYIASKFTFTSDDDEPELSYDSQIRKNNTGADQGKKKRSVTRSISRIARQTWTGPPRSPSLDTGRTPERAPSEKDVLSNHRGLEPQPVSTGVNGSTMVNGHGQTQPQDGTVGRTKARRPLSSLMTIIPSEQNYPSVPPIPKSFSTDRLPLSHAHASSEVPPSLPKSRSFERLQANGIESPRKKDELWSAFRALDGDFQKFYSRPSSSKCAAIRSTLMPFLKAHTEPLPNFTLKPEDLDRRVNVLNKWWTGLLEMLNGRNGESLSGSDRPYVLDAVTAIMIRPEWSVSPSTSTLRSARPSLKSRSTTSLGSTLSDFLAESVVHNIRNTYVQNLLAQMAFVVDKMSIRSVPASVVAFCGKAIAYAFFYCDGVAEILVRLWSVSPNALKHVHTAHGSRNGGDLRQIAGKISGRFPACLRNLAFSSVRSMLRHLSSRPQVSIATSYIPWNGPWTGRWAGRDTDLFFSFTKYYYDLLSQHLPDNVSREEQICAPGYVLVQAQLLTLLKGTIQRITSQPTIDPLKGPSFDDPMAEPDVSAAVLPISPVSMNRSMAENRLIMLLRDCLSGNAAITPKAQELFADSFQSLLKATATQTSRFDHLACFTLCDFLEEAIVIFVRYCQSVDTTVSNLDWAFWINVFKLMMESNNSMTEIRLCAFLYSLWGTITSDPSRRREVCLGWLLSEETFVRQFNHWCPMVRAFYMRLLVWRVGRFDAVASEDDRAILETLSARLNTVWRHLLWLQDRAKEQSSVAPSTAPCSPAPSRCLLILRNDQPPPPGMFLSFDNILSAVSNSSSGPSRPTSRDSVVLSSPSASINASAAAETASSGGKRRWGLLKSILPFSSSSGPSSDSRPPAIDNVSKPQDKVPPASALSGTPGPQPVTAYRSHSFKFHLEWFENANFPSRDRKLFPPKLPTPAQLFLESLGTVPQDNTPLRPDGATAGPSKYAGRALAEWAILVGECHNFFERRKAEGVPDNSKVETPTLSIDPFRRPG